MKIKKENETYILKTDSGYFIARLLESEVQELFEFVKSEQAAPEQAPSKENSSIKPSLPPQPSLEQP